MTMPHPLPFGLRDIKLRPVLTNNTLGAAVDLPVARTFSFSETEEYSELAGDDTTAASHGAGPVVEWDLEAGGISFEAWKIIAGGTITESGTTPAKKKTFTKLTTDARPYFQVEGQAISDSGGDVHCVVYRCKCDGDLEGEFANGEFLLTSASGKGFGDLVSKKLYDFVQNETEVPISTA